jgi:hypothetical protein
MHNKKNPQKQTNEKTIFAKNKNYIKNENKISVISYVTLK